MPVRFLPAEWPVGLVRDTATRCSTTSAISRRAFATGGIQQRSSRVFVFPTSTYTLDTSTLFRNPDGSNPYAAPDHLPFMDIYDPDSYYTGPINRLLTGKTDGELDNRALYAFDTLRFGEQWMLSLGARYERNEGSSTAYTVSSAGSNTARSRARAPGEERG